MVKTDREDAVDKAFEMAKMLNEVNFNKIQKALRKLEKNENAEEDIKQAVLDAGLGETRAKWLANYLKNYDQSLLDADTGW